ncbi:hypothetical protein [Lichenibacterium minor]|uniref:hypothetical protein n=1 Tax=Lichenibacterium minor TaxID=2316528 RepID=UPI0013EE0360|nr:hypothetical protein [Lichenibacterium minor]
MIPQRQCLSCGLPNFSTPVPLRVHQRMETGMDKSMWIAAGAFTAWMMIGVAAMM